MIMDCAVYENGQRLEDQPTLADAWQACQAKDAFLWIGLVEPDVEEFAGVRRAFGLHELPVEDAIKAHQRPKLEIYGDSLFIVLKPARYRRREHAVELGEIFLFVGTHFVVSVRHGKATELSGVRHTIEARPDLLRMGPSAVLHGILDHVVDDYRAATTDLEQQIEEEIEAEVLLPKSRCSPEDIYKLKREVLQFNTATAPLLEPLELLAHSKTPLIHPEIADYLRDVHDHLLKVVHDIHRFRELLGNAMDLHLSSTSARLNARLGQLTLVASLFLPLTFLTGFFGMNFGYLVNHIGSPAALGLGLLLMVASVVLQLLFFRRSGFLSL